MTKFEDAQYGIGFNRKTCMAEAVKYTHATDHHLVGYKLRKNGYFVKNETYPHRAGIGRLYPIHIEHYDCEVLKPGDFTIKKNTLYTIRPFKTWKYDDVIRVAAEL